MSKHKEAKISVKACRTLYKMCTENVVRLHAPNCIIMWGGEQCSFDVEH